MTRLVSDDRIKTVVDMIIHEYNSENVDLARQLYNSTKHVLVNQNATIDLEKLNHELGDLLPKITHVGGKRKSKKMIKWSITYKKRMNCNRPKGFSQKQYCKYQKKRIQNNKLDN